MATIGAFEAKTHFSELLRRIEQGESFDIQRRGKTVARLTKADKQPGAEEMNTSLAYFRQVRARARASSRELLQWRDEGRRS